MENTQLEIDSYVDLFSASDADSGQRIFTAEPAPYCGKPSLLRQRGNTHKFNEFGKWPDQHYHAHSEDDIVHIEKVVLDGRYYKAQRDQFYQTFSSPQEAPRRISMIIFVRSSSTRVSIQKIMRNR